MKTINLDEAIAPDEPLAITLHGSTYKVKKPTAWQRFEAARIKRFTPEGVVAARSFLQEALPDIPTDVLDSISMNEFNGLIHAITTGKAPEMVDDSDEDSQGGPPLGNEREAVPAT